MMTAHMITASRTLTLFGIMCGALIIPAHAQGKSESAPGQIKKGAAAAAGATVSPATSTSATSAPSTAPNRVLYYGSWLDDASVMDPGTTWLGVSSAYWQADTARQVDAPVLMVARGLSRRTQVGASLPIFHFRDDTGSAASGVGTVSVYGKLMIVDPAGSHGVGIGIAPLIEVASGAGERFGWALPVNVESRRDRFKVYGSGGYFSRGAVFATAAVEIPTSPRTSVSGNFGQSHSGGSHQTSVGISGSFSPTSTTGFFASLGRSSAAAGLQNGGISFGGGMSMLWAPKRP
jgi:hypothetical protein